MSYLRDYAKKYARKKVKNAFKSLIIKLLAPFMPVIIVTLIVLILTLTVTTAIYGQLTGGQTLLSGAAEMPTGEDIEYKKYIVEKTDKTNVEETYLDGHKIRALVDAYGRDRSLVLTWGHLYTAAMLKNTIRNSEVTKELIDEIAKEFQPVFIYQSYPRKIKKLVEKEVIVTDENGNKTTQTVKEWETIEYKVPLLISADTIFGKYEFTHEEVTEDHGDVIITYMKPKETKLVSAEYERLKKFLVNVGIEDKDLDLQVRIFLEASTGFVEERERMEWMMTVGDGAYRYVSYATVPAEILPYIKEIAEKYKIPIWFLCAVIQKESSFNPMAVNSSSGALGLMQVMPSNWEYYAPKLGYDPVKDKFNPKAQLDVGTYLLKSYIGNVNFDSELWKEQTLEGLARYGGFSDIERARREYAEKIWTLAETFKMSFSGSATWPVPGYFSISSPFGPRIHPVFGTVRMHEGIDIPCPVNTPAVAVTNGVVVYAGWLDGYGNTVVIRDMTHDYLYAHLNAILVKPGDTVTVGQTIALTGNTGVSTGPHLHFGISIGDFRNDRWIDPTMILQK